MQAWTKIAAAGLAIAAVWWAITSHRNSEDRRHLLLRTRNEGPTLHTTKTQTGHSPSFGKSADKLKWVPIERRRGAIRSARSIS
jgi:hypothetical protein